MRFKNIYNEAQQNAELSLLSLWTPGHHIMRDALKDMFEREPLMAEPVFQSMFPWEATTDPNWKTYLDADVVSKLNVDAHVPYKHQAECWKQLHCGNSVVVTSGTGSGKTECFLYPVLSDLYTHKGHTSADPVQAIFLYPLNALMEDQKNRLGKACHELDLKFAVYNSSLKSHPKFTHSDYPDVEVVDREAMRKYDPGAVSCPQIMLTNTSMLEFLLVRDADKDIFQRSQGQLRWIVIDEAHTYTGSAALELAYLIKRMLNAFGVTRDQVRIVCTSATIGDPSRPKELVDFIESIIGTYSSACRKKLVPVDGVRLPFVNTVKDIDAALSAAHVTLTTGKSVDMLRHELNRRAMKLSEIWQALTISPFSTDKALDLLDVLCEINVNGEPLLMARGHFFMRTVEGLYCCLDHQTQVPNGFGILTSYRRNGKCPECGKQLFEIVQCDECKEFLLSIEENDNHEIRPSYQIVSEEATSYYHLQNKEEEETDSVNLLTADVENSSVEPSGWQKKYLAYYGQTRTYLKPNPDYKENRYFISSLGNGYSLACNPLGPWRDSDKGGNTFCATCANGYGENGKNLRKFILSTNWANSTIAPALMRENRSKKDWGKYIAFTDSRQGTAISAKRFNIDSERRYYRMKLLEELSKPRLTDITPFKPVLDYIESQHKDDPQKAKKKQEEFLASKGVSLVPSYPQLTLREVADLICNDELFEHIDHDINPARRLLDKEAYKEALIIGNIAHRNISKPNAETLGIITLTYPKIESLKTLPAEWSRQGFTLSEYKTFLKIAIDYEFRVRNRYQDVLNSSVKEYLREATWSQPYDMNEWPHVEVVNGEVSTRQSRLVLLLCASLCIDSPAALKNKAVTVDNLLNDVKDYLEKSILKQVVAPDYVRKDDNHNPCYPYVGWYYLDMSLDSQVCKIKKLLTAEVCPVEYNLLDVSFRGYSPNMKGCLSAENIRRYKIVSGIQNMPIPSSANFAFDIQNLKDKGLWTDLLKYAYIPVKDCYLAAEHSGQQDREILKYYTNEFINDSLNLLQCSTTMEMGVNIGDLDVVFMSSVPPTSANYLQRAGRAGRFGQSRAVAFSLCPNTSIGMRAFQDTMQNIVSVNKASIPVGSVIITQRHINSFFVKEYVWSTGASFNKVEKWLQGTPGNNEYSAFTKWLKNSRNDKILKSKYAEIFGAVIPMSQAIDKCTSIIDEIARDFQSIICNIEAAIKNPATFPDKRNFLAVQENLLLGQELKGFLAEKQFLPNASMPTGIVEFTYLDSQSYSYIQQLKKEIDQLETKKSTLVNSGQINKLEGDIRGKENKITSIIEGHMASREMKQALFEYAPGQTVVINEKNYISAGIDTSNSFNNRSPWMYLYFCNHCGRYEYTSDPLLTDCSCGHPYSNILMPNSSKHCVYAIEPTRFRTDVNKSSDRKEKTEKRYYEINTILTNVNWNNAILGPNCDVVGNDAAEGEIVFYNAGNGRGFTICLDCNKMEATQKIRKNHTWQHKNIGESEDCSGSTVENNIILAGKFPTSFVSLRFYEDSSHVRFITDEQLAYSLGVILQHALVNVIGVHVDDIDFGVRAESNTYSVYIYDTAKGGSGYSTKMLDSMILNNVFDEAKRLLTSYTCRCETHISGACVNCLVDRYSQRVEEKLSKYKLVKWFAAQKMSSKPHSTGASAVMTPLKTIITGLASDQTVNRLALCVDGSSLNTNDWASKNGEMGMILNDCTKRGKNVTIYVSNVPDPSAQGITVSDILPYVDLNHKFPNFTVKAVESIELTPGIISACIVDDKAHYFTNQNDVLLGDETWSLNCTSLFENRSIPSFVEKPFPTFADCNRLMQPAQICRTAKIENMPNTTVGSVYADVIKPNLLAADDEAVRNILNGQDVEVTFSDSYINSALSVLMFVFILKSLRDDYGFNIAKLNLKLKSRKRACRNLLYAPDSYIGYNFENEISADEYIEYVVGNELGVKPMLLNLAPDHYRWLKIQPIGSTQSIEIRPDYGMHGGWFSFETYRDLLLLDQTTQIVRARGVDAIIYYLVVNTK